MQLATISVIPMDDGYQATLNGDPTLWGRGHTVAEAVYNVLRTHGTDFGIKFVVRAK